MKQGTLDFDMDLSFSLTIRLGLKPNLKNKIVMHC